MRLADRIIYYVRGGNVEKYIEVDDCLIPYGNTFYSKSKIVYDSIHKDIKEARYIAMVFRLQEGALLSNYKGSIYYKMYLKRLKEEHPELII